MFLYEICVFLPARRLFWLVQLHMQDPHVWIIWNGSFQGSACCTSQNGFQALGSRLYHSEEAEEVYHRCLVTARLYLLLSPLSSLVPNFCLVYHWFKYSNKVDADVCSWRWCSEGNPNRDELLRISMQTTLRWLHFLLPCLTQSDMVNNILVLSREVFFTSGSRTGMRRLGLHCRVWGCQSRLRRSWGVIWITGACSRSRGMISDAWCYSTTTFLVLFISFCRPDVLLCWRSFYYWESQHDWEWDWCSYRCWTPYPCARMSSPWLRFIWLVIERVASSAPHGWTTRVSITHASIALRMTPAISV